MCMHHKMIVSKVIYIYHHLWFVYKSITVLNPAVSDQKKKVKRQKKKDEAAVREQKKDENDIVSLDKLQTKIRMGIDNKSDKLIGAFGTVLNPDCVGGNDGGGSVNLSEIGFILIPANNESIAQAKIMHKELEETVKDEAILTGGQVYNNQNNPTLTCSYFVFSKKVGKKLKKRKQAFKGLYMKCGKNNHRIITDLLKVNSYEELCAKPTHRDTKFYNSTKGLLCQQLEKPNGGSLLWIDSDGLEYEVEVPIGEKLLMFDIAERCKHKCKTGQYTIVTDFIINHYQSFLHYKEDEFIGLLQEMLGDYEKKYVEEE